MSNTIAFNIVILSLDFIGTLSRYSTVDICYLYVVYVLLHPDMNQEQVVMLHATFFLYKGAIYILLDVYTTTIYKV